MQKETEGNIHIQLIGTMYSKQGFAMKRDLLSQFSFLTKILQHIKSQQEQLRPATRRKAAKQPLYQHHSLNLEGSA